MSDARVVSEERPVARLPQGGLRIQPLTEVPVQDVESLVVRSAGGWVGHLGQWARIAEAVFEQRDLSFAVLHAQPPRVVGLCPLALKRAWGFRLLESAAFGGYGGPLIADDVPESRQKEVFRLMVEQIEALAQRHRIDRIHLLPFPSVLNGIPLGPQGWEEAGFRPRAYELYLLDLSHDLDTLRQRCAQNVRHAIGQARRFGVSVTHDPSPQALETFYALFVEAHRRSGGHVLPVDYFRRLRQSWGSHGELFHLFLASHGGRPVAASLIAGWKNWAVFWSNGSNEQGRRVRANNLLQWEILCWLKAHGIRWYEVGREQPGFHSQKQQRIDFFKTRFGAVRVPAVAWVRHGRPWRAALYETARPWATRLRSR